MGTTMREHHTRPRLFKGRRERPGPPMTKEAFPDAKPSLRAIRFQGNGAVKKKRKLFPGHPPTSPSSFALPPNRLAMAREC